MIGENFLISSASLNNPIISKDRIFGNYQIGFLFEPNSYVIVGNFDEDPKDGDSAERYHGLCQQAHWNNCHRDHSCAGLTFIRAANVHVGRSFRLADTSCTSQASFGLRNTNRRNG